MPRALMFGLVAALVASAVGAAPAQAAVPRAHVVTLAGSDGYLVYKVERSTKAVHPHDVGGAVYARDRRGRVQALRHFADGVGVIQQTGHSVVEKTFTNVPVDGGTIGVQRVRYRDLTTRQEHVTTLRPFESMAAVAPDGYLVRHDLGGGDGGSTAGTTTLTYRHADGSTADIAVPFAHGQDYALGATDTGLMAVSPGSDEQTLPSRVAYMTWAHPGVWRQLYDAGRPRYIGCAPSSRTDVACRVDGVDSGGPGLVLLRLRDGHATWLHRTHPKACTAVTWATKGSSLWALETSDAGVCTEGKLFRLQEDGALVGGSSRYRFDAAGGIETAYGRAVVGDRDQRHLYSTTGVTRKPVLVVTA